MVGAFLRDRRWSRVFLAGVFTGLLPCGLVYAFVALAASTSDLMEGLVTMCRCRYRVDRRRYLRLGLQMRESTSVGCR
jgi:hypothetical protein